MYDDVLQRNDKGELELRTVASTGDTSTNKDDVFTRDENGNLCVRTTGGGGGTGGTVITDGTTISGNGTKENPLKTTNPVPAGGNENQVLTKTADGVAWKDPQGGGTALPDQAGNAGKVLGTNGTDASWVDIPKELPNQTGNSGKVLSTDGQTPQWIPSSGGGGSIDPYVSSSVIENSGGIYLPTFVKVATIDPSIEGNYNLSVSFTRKDYSVFGELSILVGPAQTISCSFLVFCTLVISDGDRSNFSIAQKENNGKVDILVSPNILFGSPGEILVTSKCFGSPNIVATDNKKYESSECIPVTNSTYLFQTINNLINKTVPQIGINKIKIVDITSSLDTVDKETTVRAGNLIINCGEGSSVHLSIEDKLDIKANETSGTISLTLAENTKLKVVSISGNAVSIKYAEYFTSLM